MDDSYRERFLRSIGIFTEEQLYKLKATKVAMGGLGLGGSIFLNLVRMGFENFHIADPDTFERTNINRQRMAKETTIGMRKDECSLAEARAINPAVKVKVFPEGVKASNLNEFLDGVDWVVDVVDLFAMEDKLALNVEAHKRGISVASCATLGFSGSVVVFNKNTPSFAELTGISMSLPYEENLSRFLRFICPEVPPYMWGQLIHAMDRTGYIPFVTPGGETSAAVAASEIAKNIVGLGRTVVAPQGIFVDVAQVRTEIFEASYKARSLNIPAHLKKPKVA
jgi:molybdopterin/thiamine biosynthesis adenylyltransferase